MPETIALRVPGSRARIRVRTAASWRGAFGLLKDGDLSDHGLWMRRCRRIHTFGLSTAVDVVFLRADGVVAKVVERMKPWRTTGCREASTVLELRPGLVERLNIAPGQALDLLA